MEVESEANRGEAIRGEALDLRGVNLDPATVLAAVRDPDDDRVVCPEPEPVHEAVGHVGRKADSRRATLAAVARARGETAPQDDELARVREQLANLDAGSTTVANAREAVAATGTERDKLRERVATLRGRVQARQERGLDATDARADLAEAARRLSEVETERTAAEQRLDAARRRAREGYDQRERRLELQDRAGNLERAARDYLAERLRPAVERALAAYPDGPADVEAADAVAVGHAAARLAPLSAPCVVTAGPFDADGAAAYLDAPAIRL